MNIALARGLSLPAQKLATSVWAALGIRGSGKSNLASVIVEGCLTSKVPTIILDPVGIHWSLRLQAGGKHPSDFSIPILGGEHGDITLMPTAGRQVAEALAASHSSAVLDISRFSKGDRVKFATDFAEAFYEAKKRSIGPVLLLLEEAQRFVPQVIRFSGTGLERCLGAFEEIAEMGRNYGIGLGLISQRPEKVNKDVLNLADTVFALRALGVHERKAIAEWVQEHEAAGRDDVKNELPQLKQGNGIVWSPALFEVYGRFHFQLKTTYDAGATPERIRAAVKVKPLDLKELEEVMGAAAAEAKANDPRALKARVAELERELAKKPAEAKTVEREILSEKHLKRLERLVDRLGKEEERFKAVGLAELEAARDRLAQAHQSVVVELGTVRVALGGRNPGMTSMFRKNYGPGASHANGEDRAKSSWKNWAKPDIKQEVKPIEPVDGDLPKYALDLLRVVAQRGRASDAQISTLSRYRRTSSAFPKNIGKLMKAGLITGDERERVITDAGRERVGAVEELPTGRALLDHWLGKLTGYQALFLRTIYDHKSIAPEDLAAVTNRSVTSSAFPKTIRALEKLDLVEEDHGFLKISGNFF